MARPKSTEKGAQPAGWIRILICFDAFVGFDHNFALYGTRGTILTDKTVAVNKGAHSFAKLSDLPIEEYESKMIEIPVTTTDANSIGGHGGADGKMVKDFISCIAENRKPELDVDFAIQMSIPGIIAHESAVLGGVPMEIPTF